MIDPVAEEFERRYRASGGTLSDPIAAVGDLFATFEQARVFALELHSTFASEQQRSQELAIALDELMASERRFRTLVSNSSDAVIVVDYGRRVSWTSESIERVWGRGASGVAGVELDDLVEPSDRPFLHAALDYVTRRPTEYRTVVVRSPNPGSTDRHIEITAGNLLAEPSVGGYVLNTRDVSERIRLESHLRRLAYHDSLTDLPNRAAFLDRLQHLNEEEGGVALLVADIVGLGTINSAQGREAGDRTLRVVAAVLALISERCGAYIARLGPDEFGMVVPLGGSVSPAEVALSASLARGVGNGVSDQRRLPACRVGWATNVAAHDAGIDTLRAAELALRQAKRLGQSRSPVVEFDWATVRMLEARASLEADVQTAAQNGELALQYQPIVEPDSQQMRAAEALVRWHHPRRGTVSPIEFIPAAERTGAIVGIGEWVLREACRQLAAWDRSEAPTHTDAFYLSVNVSVIELLEPSFVTRMSNILAESAVHPGRIQLEVTESSFATEPDRILKVLESVKAIGVHLAIDDFGTGYSSLSYIAAMPADVIKLDRSFVVNMHESARIAAVVNATMSLAETLGLTVVAEGVETTEQEKQLRALGPVLIQGYLRGRPADPKQLNFPAPSQAHMRRSSGFTVVPLSASASKTVNAASVSRQGAA